MTNKAMPEVDRIAANRAAVASRQERAELKRALRSGEVDHVSVLEQVCARKSPASWRALRVSDFLGTVPGVGDVGAARAMNVLGFAEGKRLGGIGVRQLDMLRRWFDSPRLVEAVLRGRTALSEDMAGYELGDLVDRLTGGSIDHADVLAMLEESSAPQGWRAMRVAEFISSVEGVGTVGAKRALAALGLNPDKRLGSLGVRQRRALRLWLRDAARVEAVLADYGVTTAALDMLDEAADA